MYQALYRKYRPTKFDQVVGQKIVVQTLKNSIKNNKLTHAYLFTGPRGTGKTSIAKILAKTINFLNLKDVTPCDECVNCIQYNKKQMIDVIEIDAASNNGVDEIRELKSKVNLVPNTGKYKIYIIDEVHMLTVGAFNALLKTLEEPPSHIVFILATTEPQKIPATILSRCQRFDFKKIPDELILNHLKEVTNVENINITDDALKELARLADGGMRDALSMLDQVSSFTDKEITPQDVHEINGTLAAEDIKELVVSLIEKDVSKVLKIINQYDKNGKNLAKLIEEIMLFMKNILMYKNAFEYFKENNSNYQLYDIDIEQKFVIKGIEILNETLGMMKQSVNQKIILETSMIKLISQEGLEEVSSSHIQKPKLEVKNLEAKTLNIDKNIPDKTTEENNITKKIKEEIEDKILDKVNQKIKEELKKVKEIRINNALSSFNKRNFLEFKNDLEQIRNLILNPEYNYEASMVLDGKLKAVGDEYLIFVYDTEHISDLFNEKLLTIEKMFKKVYNKDYKIISTYLDEWNVIKDDFNNKKREFKHIDDNINIEEILNSNEKTSVNNDIDQLFDNIVEYN